MAIHPSMTNASMNITDVSSFWTLFKENETKFKNISTLIKELSIDAITTEVENIIDDLWQVIVQVSKIYIIIIIITI